MIIESLEDSPIDFYRPDELRALLEHSEGAMRAIIAMQALAGLRLDEALRFDWKDVFGIAGHIEVSTAKAKTRQRRLVEICPALEKWLEPYLELEGRVGAQWQTTHRYCQAVVKMRKEAGIPSRRNGLRRGFATYHFAVHNNENLTAALMGNSPRMVHRNYKGLATKAEAKAWFDVKPSAPANVVPITTSKTG
jgi:integrase